MSNLNPRSVLGGNSYKSVHSTLGLKNLDFIQALQQPSICGIISPFHLILQRGKVQSGSQVYLAVLDFDISLANIRASFFKCLFCSVGFRFPLYNLYNPVQLQTLVLWIRVMCILSLILCSQYLSIRLYCHAMRQKEISRGKVTRSSSPLKAGVTE